MHLIVTFQLTNPSLLPHHQPLPNDELSLEFRKFATPNPHSLANTELLTMSLP
jgi:hypothetical protein